MTVLNLLLINDLAFFLMDFSSDLHIFKEEVIRKRFPSLAPIIYRHIFVYPSEKNDLFGAFGEDIRFLIGFLLRMIPQTSQVVSDLFSTWSASIVTSAYAIITF